MAWPSLTSVRLHVQIAHPRAHAAPVGTKQQRQHAAPIGTKQQRQKPVDEWIDTDDEDDVESEFGCDIRIEQQVRGTPYFKKACKAGTISFDSETFELTANMKTSVRQPFRSVTVGVASCPIVRPSRESSSACDLILEDNTTCSTFDAVLGMGLTPR